jgi:hypothetical protein
MSGDHNQHQKPTSKDSLQVEAEQGVDWEAVAADQAMTIAMMKTEQAGEQEPVAYMDDKGYICNHTTNPERWIPLYTAPPQRQWTGLTDDEICEVVEIDGADAWLFRAARAIEAKLKEKNT